MPFSKTIGVVTAATIVCIVGLAPANAASLLTNGSFEDVNSTFSPGGSDFQTLANGSTAIAGWTVGSNNSVDPGAGSIDWIRSYWQPHDGSFSIDLNGLNLGSVSQTFATVANQTYVVQFWMAGNPDNGPTIKKLDAGVTVAVPFTFDITGRDKSNMGWTLEQFLFTATGASSTLTFTSTAGDSSLPANPNAFGAALDDVSVTAVPEASTWAMLMLGFAGLGFAAYSRKSKSTLMAA